MPNEWKSDLRRDWKSWPPQFLCIDLRETKYASGRKKAHLIATIDSGNGWVAGWAVTKSANRKLVLKCWEAAKEILTMVGQDPKGLIMHHHQGTVYMSYRWLR